MTFEFSEVDIFSILNESSDGNTSANSGFDSSIPGSRSPVGSSGELNEAQELFTFALVDSDTEEVVATFEDIANGEADIFTGNDFENFTIVGIVNPNHEDADRIESIQFESSLGDRIENVAPYALFGARRGDFAGSPIDEGAVSVIATAYTRDNARGDVLDIRQLNYNIVDGTVVSSSADASAQPTNVRSQNATASSRSPGEVIHRINVGGRRLQTDDGVIWSADNKNNPSSFRIGNGGNRLSFLRNTSVLDLTDSSLPGYSQLPNLFATSRWDPQSGRNMQWQFDVRNGEYEVRLYLAESYSGITGTGQRVFDVALEGRVSGNFNNIDPFSIGGANGGFTISETTTVRDGMLNVEFLRGVQNPAVNGIEIVRLDTSTPTVPEASPTPPASEPEVSQNPPTSPTPTSSSSSDDTVIHRINVGGRQIQSSEGTIWTADTLNNPASFRVGNSGERVSVIRDNSVLDVSNTGLPDYAQLNELFATSRWDPQSGQELQWQFDVQNGDYEVRLYLAETYDGITRSGQRVFDVALEGEVTGSFDNIDPFAIGGFNRGFVLAENTTVRDGTLNIEFLRGIQNPVVSGIEIVQLDASTSASESQPPVSEPPLNPDTPLFSLGLIDATTDQLIPGFESLAGDEVINLDNIDTNRYTIAAIVNPDLADRVDIGSIRFETEFGDRVDNFAPYALFGDNRGNFFGQEPVAGEYSLRATAYSERAGEGEVLDSIEIDYSFTGRQTNNEEPDSPEPEPSQPTPEPSQPTPPATPEPPRPLPVDPIEPSPTTPDSFNPHADSVLDLSLPDDKQAEQQRVLSLVPDGSETHRAVRNGAWRDARTWENGAIPSAGARVYIPADVSVEIDNRIQNPIWTIRVDGELNFSETQNTQLKVDTIVVLNNGELNIGSKEQAVRDGVTAEIIFTDDPRALNDPASLSLGLVSIGTVNVHGQEKRSHLKVQRDPLRGDTSLTLAEVPQGWKVGDRIVLTGTRAGSSATNTQDEELVITRINGRTVEFNRALRFDHDTPRADLKAYVANLSRNVIFRSENPDNINQRGHIIFMHNDNVDFRFAQLTELGRTDKSRNVGSGGNQNGRYGIHLHRQDVKLDDTPAIIVGNALEGSPGWGYVHHSSYAIIDHNVAYDVFGGAFIAESGDETGRWENNIAIKGTGNGGGPKTAANTLNVANNGTGFYFQGRLVHNQDNVAVSQSGYGFVYFHRNTGSSVRGVDVSTVEAPFTNRYKDDNSPTVISIDAPSIQGFENNEAFASEHGLIIIKNSSNQGHTNRTILEGFKAWEVDNGVELDYTGHYTLNNFELIASEESADRPWDSRGVEIGQNIIDIVINDLYVEGFHEGVNVSRIDSKQQFNDIPGNITLIDYEVADINVRIDNNGHRNGHIVELDSSGLVAGPVVLDLTRNSDLHISAFGTRENIVLRGTQTDSLGTYTYGITESHATLRGYHDIDLRNLVNAGYYTLPNGQKAVLLQEQTAHRLSGGWCIQDVVITVDDGLISNDVPFLGRLDATRNADGVWVTNSAANARFDSIDVERNTPVTFSVFANDTDMDGDSFSLEGFTVAGNGRLELIDARTGTFRYTPDPNFDGYDYFEYTISDRNNSGRSTTARVQLKIDTV